MCVHGEFHQYPRARSPPPTVTRKSLCKLSKIVFVFNDNHMEPPLSLLRVDPLCVGDDPERGWELSSSCRRGSLKSSWGLGVWSCEGCSPGERRNPTGSCSHGRGGSSQGIVSSCHLPVPASLILSTDHQYTNINQIIQNWDPIYPV